MRYMLKVIIVYDILLQSFKLYFVESYDVFFSDYDWIFGKYLDDLRVEDCLGIRCFDWIVICIGLLKWIIYYSSDFVLLENLFWKIIINQMGLKFRGLDLLKLLFF